MIFKDRVVVVTGGSRGIGREISRMFAAEGAKVVINYHQDDDNAAAFLKELKEITPYAVLYKCSVCDFDNVRSMFDYTRECFGDTGILVNNAGIEKTGMLMTLKESDYRGVIETNLIGTLNCCKLALSHMISNRYGRIINISSAAGIRANPGQSAYSASKAGVNALTGVISKEVAGFGITVNAIAPGYIATEMSRDYEAAFVKNIPVKKFGEVSDVANLVKFLAGDEASYCTGQVYAVDGGLLA